MLASSKRQCQELRTSSKDCRGFIVGDRWERADRSVKTRHVDIKWMGNNPSYAVALAGQIQRHLKSVEGILLTSKGIESSLSKSLFIFCLLLKPQYSADDTEIISLCVSHFNLRETYHSDELNLVFSIYCSTIKTHYYLLGPTIPHFFRLKNCMWPLNQWEHHKIFYIYSLFLWEINFIRLFFAVIGHC